MFQEAELKLVMCNPCDQVEDFMQPSFIRFLL